MICGFPKSDGSACGDPLIAIGGSRANLRYSCRNHRFKGTGQNSLTVTRTELENQLMDALVSQFLQPEMVGLASKSSMNSFERKAARRMPNVNKP